MLSVLLRTPSMPLYLRYKRMALPSGTVRGPVLEANGPNWMEIISAKSVIYRTAIWQSHCIVFARQGRSSQQARRFPGPSFGRPGTAGGDRAGAGGALSQGARPRRRRDGAAASLHLTDLASLSQARQVDRGTPALALSEGHLHGRFLRGACGALGARGAGALGLDHCPPQGGLARRAGALATARSLGQASCLLLGRRRLLLTTARP